MRNYEQEQYAFLAHYGTPGMKRPHGLRYKTKHHVGDAIYTQKGIADDVGDMKKKTKRRKFITNATSKLNRSVSDDIDEFYKNKAKGESKDSLRLKRIAQVRATEAMAPIAAAQEKLFKKKKKKELPINQKAMKLFKINNVLKYNYKRKKKAFIRDNVVKPAMEANTPENRAAHIVRKATKEAAKKTTNPLTPGSMRTSMETMINTAKAKHPTAVATRRAYAGTWNALYNAPGSPKKAANNVRWPVKDGLVNPPSAKAKTTATYGSTKKRSTSSRKVSDDINEFYKGSRVRENVANSSTESVKKAVSSTTNKRWKILKDTDTKVDPMAKKKKKK